MSKDAKLLHLDAIKSASIGTVYNTLAATLLVYAGQGFKLLAASHATIPTSDERIC